MRFKLKNLMNALKATITNQFLFGVSLSRTLNCRFIQALFLKLSNEKSFEFIK